jgi:TldD protein
MKTSMQAALTAALSTGGDFAEIFLEDNRSHSLQMLGGQLELVNSNRAHGAGIRVFDGLNAVYAYTNDTDPEGLLRCALQAASAVREQRRALVQARPFVVPSLPAALPSGSFPPPPIPNRSFPTCARRTRRPAP